MKGITLFGYLQLYLSIFCLNVLNSIFQIYVNIVPTKVMKFPFCLGLLYQAWMVLIDGPKSIHHLPNLDLEHLLFRWIVLRVLWQLFWRFEPRGRSQTTRTIVLVLFF